MPRNQDDGCKKCDIFGHSIHLNYRGMGSYRTTCGSCVSILLILTMFFVLTIKVKFILLTWLQPGLVGKSIS